MSIVILAQVAEERQRQDARWGEQNHPDGTGSAGSRYVSSLARTRTESAVQTGTLNWRHILEEEVHEVFAEKDPALLRAELIQVAAVAVAWIEAIDRRAT